MIMGTMERNTVRPPPRATGTGAAPRVPVTSSTNDALMLECHQRVLRESFSRCRRDVSRPQTDRAVQNLIRRVENDRVHLTKHLVTLLYDAFSRGAPRAHVEAPARATLAMVAQWYDGYNEHDASGALPDLVRCARAAAVNAALAEIDLLVNPTPKTIADAGEQFTVELCALESLVLACERQRFQRVA